MASKSRSVRSAQMRRAGQWLVYALFRIVETALSLVPLPLVALLGRCIGLVIWLIALPYRRLAARNVRIAFGRELDAAAQARMVRQHFMSLGSNFLCGLKLPLMRESDIISRVSISGVEHSRQIADSGRPLLYAVCHLSCWELLTQVPSLFVPTGMKPASIYQALANPFLNEHVRRRREQLGYTLFDRKDGFMGPLKLLREQRGALGVLVDQHAGDGGVWCPFFDRLASTTPLPALMAIRCRTPLLPITVQDAGLARWKMVIHPPVTSGEERPSAEGLTAALNLRVEQIIREAPANWFWVHNRWKTPKPDFLLSGYKRGIVWPTGYARDRLQPFEVILRSPNWLGDACMAFPAVRALRDGRPDLRLTVFTPAKLADLWRSLGIIDEVICKEKGDSVLAAARRINRSGRTYDVGLFFTNSTRSTLEFALARIERLVGYQGSLRAFFLEQIIPESRPGSAPEHQAQKGLRMAAHCGADCQAAGLFGGEERRELATSPLHIGICAGAEFGPAKRWPLERYAEVMKLVSAQRAGIEWQFFGAPGEKEMGEKLSMMVSAAHQNLVGKTSMPELITALKRCTLLVTNDTGTMHLAAALGVPTVSIFGSTEPLLTGPLGTQHSIVRHHVPCSPCFKRECPLSHYDCMSGISAERVAEAVLQRVSADRGGSPLPVESS
jgi:heptosyltransferase II